MLKHGNIILTILLALGFAGVVMVPQMLQHADQKYPYQGVELMGPDAETHYAARVREVLDGFPGLGNTYYSAPKDLPFLQPPLPEMALAATAKLLSADPVTVFIWSKAVLGAVVFMLFVVFLTIITGNASISIVATAAMLFGGALLAAPWDLPHFLWPASANFEFLRFARAINPQWTVSWFLIVFIAIGLWLRKPRLWHLVLAAAAFDVLIYSYVYAWSLALVALGLLTLWFIFKRDWSRCKQLGLFWVLVVPALLLYSYHLWITTYHPWYVESALRLGLHASRTPVYGVWAFVFIGVAFLSRRWWPATWPLLPCLGLAGLIAMNQHVLTGQFIAPHHYHWYFIQPLGSLVALALMLAFLKPFLVGRQFLWTGLLTLMIFGSVGVALVQQFGAYRGVAKFWGGFQPLAPTLQDLALYTHPGDVVYARDIDILSLIPVYTSADVYAAGNANNYLVPLERAQAVYFFQLWVNGVSAEDAAKTFPTSRRYELSSQLYAIYYRELLGGYDKIPDDEVERQVEAYRDYVQLPFDTKLTRYPLTHIVTSPDDRTTPEWRQLLGCSKPVFEDGAYTVRTMIPVGEMGSCL